MLWRRSPFSAGLPRAPCSRGKSTSGQAPPLNGGAPHGPVLAVSARPSARRAYPCGNHGQGRAEFVGFTAGPCPTGGGRRGGRARTRREDAGPPEALPPPAHAASPFAQHVAGREAAVGRAGASLAKLDRELGSLPAEACLRLMREASLRAKYVVGVRHGGATGRVRPPQPVAGPGSAMELACRPWWPRKRACRWWPGFRRVGPRRRRGRGPLWAWPDWLMFRDDRLSPRRRPARAIATITSSAGPPRVRGHGLRHRARHDPARRGGGGPSSNAPRRRRRPGRPRQRHEPLLNELMSAEHFQRKCPKLAAAGRLGGPAVRGLR